MVDQSAVCLIHCIVENGIPDTECSMLDARLSSVQYKDIAAVVRKVDAKTAEEIGCHEEKLRNWLEAYQQTNIDIFRHYPMLPLRFGIMVDREKEVENFLSASYIHLKSALDRLRGKAEIAVHLSWDLDAVLQEIGRDRDWLGMPDKLELGRLLFIAADARKKEIVNCVDGKLSEVSLGSSEGRSADEAIIMNRSYLIEKAEEQSFDEAIAELAEKGESYLSIKYVGPMPPYSFAPLQFSQGNFELIDGARRTLSLRERAHFQDIKNAYRRLSLQHHPDKNSGDAQASEHFRHIDEAYRTLEMYCFSCEGSLASREEAEYSFAKHDVEEAFVVEGASAR